MKTIAQCAGRPTGEGACQLCAVICGAAQLGSVERRRCCFQATKEGRSQVRAACAKRESGGEHSLAMPPASITGTRTAVDDLGEQPHCTDHSGSGTVSEATATASGFVLLRDDDIGATSFERAGLGDGRRGTENSAGCRSRSRTARSDRGVQSPVRCGLALVRRDRDRLDQRCIIVFDIPDSLAHRPAGHLV